MLKKIMYALLGVIGLVMVGVAVVLVPAHWELRHVEVSLPSLEAIQSQIGAPGTGDTDYPVEMRYVLSGSQRSGTREVAYAAVTIRWPDGRIFLIDAGMDREQTAEFGRTMERIGASPVETFGSVKDQIGSAIGDVRGIGFTHLHEDHTLGITDICATTLERAIIFRTAYQDTSHILHTKNSHQLVSAAACGKATLSDDPIKKVPGFPGLYALDAAGHTPCSTIYIVRLHDKTVILAGDLTGSKADIENNQPKPWLYSYFLVPENPPLLAEWRAWLQRAQSLPNTSVVVAHDLKSYQDASIAPWVSTP